MRNPWRRFRTWRAERQREKSAQVVIDIRYKGGLRMRFYDPKFELVGQNRHEGLVDVGFNTDVYKPSEPEFSLKVMDEHGQLHDPEPWNEDDE